MGRWFILVVLTCVVVSCVVFLQTPISDFLRVSMDAGTEENRKASDGSPEAMLAVEADIAASPSVASRSENPEGLSVAIPLDSPAQFVLTDSTPVYSGNWDDGEPLQRLPEGTAVERGVEILSSEGLWTQVRFDEQRVGFVRAESLSTGTGWSVVAASGLQQSYH